MIEDQEAYRQGILTRARAASRHPVTDHKAFRALHWELHALAEEHYESAIPFFEDCLHNVDSNWRDSGIELLGFHYLDYLDGNDSLFERFRYLLANDPDSDVRMTAASLLIHAKEESVFPDWALLQALEEDPVIQVRESAFESLMIHAEIPYIVRQEALRQVDRKEILATPLALKRIIEEQGLTVPTEALAVPFRERFPR